MTSDARAKITLPDGRQIWRYGNGRYRVIKTGKWIAKEEVEDALAQASSIDHNLTAAQKQLIETVREMGREADTLDEALAQLLAVQAEIALDKDNGAKATNATRLIGQISGIWDKNAQKEDAQQDDDQPWFVLGRELAQELLALVEAEQAFRAQANA